MSIIEITQTRRFAKTYKKQHKQNLIAINQAINSLIKNPFIGERKKGDLAELYVYKFKVQNQTILLGYTLDNHQQPSQLTLEALGAHENFYRDLKR